MKLIQSTPFENVTNISDSVGLIVLNTNLLNLVTLTHCLLVTRILVIKWVSQDANMTSLLVMELAAAVGESIELWLRMGEFIPVRAQGCMGLSHNNVM